MAKNRSDKCPYPSKYSPGGWVRADQYIIEIICERKAQSMKKDLPIKFWNIAEWEGYFKMQLRVCRKLINKYGAKAVIEALKDDRGKRIFTLHAKWLIPIIEEKHKILNTVIEKPVIKKADATKVGNNERREQNVKTRLSILEAFDNGEEESER